MNSTGLLITGISGLIGSILREALSGRFEVYGLDRNPCPSCSKFIQVDLTDREAVRQALREMHGMKFLIHLAGDARADADWESVWKHNMLATWNLYQLAAERGEFRRVIFASSNHVTGAYEWDWLKSRQEGEMLASNDPIRPDGPYGISKLAGEAIARYFFDRRGLASVCLRIGTVNPPPGLPQSDRQLSTWLSHGDLVRLVECALATDATFPGFGIYYGVSANDRRFWDLSSAAQELGYHPLDNASDYWPPSVS